MAPQAISVKVTMMRLKVLIAVEGGGSVSNTGFVLAEPSGSRSMTSDVFIRVIPKSFRKLSAQRNVSAPKNFLTAVAADLFLESCRRRTMSQKAVGGEKFFGADSFLKSFGAANFQNFLGKVAAFPTPALS